uniref:Reverse transcriptase zinc-binding domain-containing protein n=1 Tax=Micrurus lemniscatus lemniscatus TaxID=129467 RepID=A0A2D4H616_MICLE
MRIRHGGCWKCKQNQGTFYHMWWPCPEAQKYWIKIWSWTKEIAEEQMKFKAEFFLLGIIKEKHRKKIKYILLHILTATRIVYALSWKQNNVPLGELTIRKILDCAEMDKWTLKTKRERRVGIL